MKIIIYSFIFSLLTAPVYLLPVLKNPNNSWLISIPYFLFAWLLATLFAFGIKIRI
jgi:hypothetical protein